MGLVKDANLAFLKGDYSKALELYKTAGQFFGSQLFNANIAICKKRLVSSRKTYALTKSEDQTLSLNEELFEISFSITAINQIDFFGSVSYQNIKDNNHPRALVSLKYFDSEGKQISGKFKGFSKSDSYGDFHYLNDTNGYYLKLFSLYPPVDANSVKIEFHPFCIKSGEAVVVSNHIDCELYRQDALKPATSSCVDLAVLGWPTLAENRQIRMMSVFDEFSRECFAPHANLIEPRPDNSIPLLKRDQPELLFIESSWRGNKSTWQYRVAKYANPPGNELSRLVAECKKLQIPSVFWNKEDPVHFGNFIHAAEIFDYIFTTAEESIPRYQERSNAKVHALPFAAESKLHNPVGSADRNKRICFAGSYYANRFKERRDDQLMLLDAATQFDLDIYDRNAGSTSKDFCFPARFDSFIRGKLDYLEINKVYRKYRLFLNVNSVIDSNTMFSRRVFELLACGTPIISTASKGIDQMFGKDIVWTVRDQGEAGEAIRHLMQDEQEWRRRSIQGIRKVFAEHTYAHRFEQVLRVIGLRENLMPLRRVLLIGEVSTQNEADALIEMQNRQYLVRSQTRLILVTKNPNIEITNSRVKTINHSNVLKQVLMNETSDWNASHIALLDPHALYGMYFLNDSLNAFEYTECLIVGKPHSNLDCYDYSKQLSPGSILMMSEFFATVYSTATALSGLEKDCLSVVEHNMAFSVDAANYLRSDAISQHGNASNALRRIEI